MATAVRAHELVLGGGPRRGGGLVALLFPRRGPVHAERRPALEHLGAVPAEPPELRTVQGAGPDRVLVAAVELQQLLVGPGLAQSHEAVPRRGEPRRIELRDGIEPLERVALHRGRVALGDLRPRRQGRHAALGARRTAAGASLALVGLVQAVEEPAAVAAEVLAQLAPHGRHGDQLRVLVVLVVHAVAGEGHDLVGQRALGGGDRRLGRLHDREALTTGAAGDLQGLQPFRLRGHVRPRGVHPLRALTVALRGLADRGDEREEPRPLHAQLVPDDAEHLPGVAVAEHEPAERGHAVAGLPRPLALLHRAEVDRLLALTLRVVHLQLEGRGHLPDPLAVREQELEVVEAVPEGDHTFRLSRVHLCTSL